MSCPYAEWKEGKKTFSHNIPGYAQGAYFPGDEEGYYCNIDGEYCSASEHDILDNCGYEKTEYYCPDCFCSGYEHIHYLFDLPQGMTCLNCGKTYTEKEWLEAINEYANDINGLFNHKNKTINELENKISKLEKEVKEKQYEIAGIKYACEMLQKERKIA